MRGGIAGTYLVQGRWVATVMLAEFLGFFGRVNNLESAAYNTDALAARSSELCRVQKFWTHLPNADHLILRGVCLLKVSWHRHVVFNARAMKLVQQRLGHQRRGILSPVEVIPKT